MHDIYSQILKQYWGYDDFRGIQRQIIESISSGKDTLGLMPTGGGKSITFQVPGMAQRGMCIVITPLIALMKDQVEHLRARGIRAGYLHKGLTSTQIYTILDNAVYGGYKFLYVSPERLRSESFQQKLRLMDVSFICVDEAHCISQWGYDFRPSYLQIKNIRNILPQAPILALTATATDKVVKDIQTQLAFREENVFRMSFERPNLTYIVKRNDSKGEELMKTLKASTGSTIIYTRTRRDCWELCDLLQQSGYSATFYHAGLDTAEKDRRQNLWQQDQVRIMVATNAFGMGIDKPDVRLVIHTELPDSVEAYYQEAGRAGRDGKPAKAIMTFSTKDSEKLRRRISENFPEKEEIRLVYEHICYYYQIADGGGQGTRKEFNIGEFCHYFHHNMVQVHSALQILTRCGYLEYTDADEGTSRLMFTLEREDLYRLREQSQEADAIIRSLLRKYTGLFVDYSVIDESLLAQEVGSTPAQVYKTLVELSKKGIIHYIPRKNVPHIAFPLNRIDKSRIVIPKEFYEHRKEEYTKRIEAIIAYAEEDNICRNTRLLAYFSEKAKKACGHCDVCLMRSFPGFSQEEREATRLNILRQIKEAGEILPFELNFMEVVDKDLAIEMLQDCVNEEELACDDCGRVHLTTRGLKKYFNR